MPAYKDKKTGTWYAAFYYQDWTGERKHTTKRGFKTQREAKEYERDFLNSKTNSGEILFKNLAAEYLGDVINELKPSTMERKSYIVNERLVPVFGSMSISDISSLSIRKWLNNLTTQKNAYGKPFNQSYIVSLYREMCTVMNYAVKHYGLTQNPCTVAGAPKKAKTSFNFWTVEQYEQFTALEDKPDYKVAFDVLFFTGMRSGELLALQKSDIMENKKISITKTYNRIKKQDIILTPKTAKSKRQVAIPDFLYDEILNYMKDMDIKEDDDRIFYMMRRTSLNKELKRVQDKLDLPYIRVHDLRHSHASMLINMGFDIKEISDRLGHENTSTTWNIYSHLYPDADSKLADRLNDIRKNSE